jgi:cyclic 2,3-diphosphoglycerate synthetase
VTDFSPVPLADVQGRRAFFATTAPRAVAERQVRHLGSVHGCTVVGWSARLADRAGLTQDLDEADDYDVLLTELKAAAVDVACERALGRGAEVVFVDNRVVTIEGENDLDGALRTVIEVALERGLDRR